ncbi:MAG TPA: molybdenum cofactor biosynthesis protein MoaE [Acidobacteriaceae bacterium]|nr:molybdenum cofactor biosynthesis protein MoaE [Acidobacteriaceae bacterium]
MHVNILLFGALKDLLARESETVELPEHATVDLLLRDYLQRAPQLQNFAGSLAIAVNREYASTKHVLREGDEVALLPPVSGGNDGQGPFVRLQREVIDASPLRSEIKNGADGAVVIFDGIVRDNTRGRRTLYLEYEAYEPMALTQMRALAAEATQRFVVRDVTLVHRLGRLQVGESSVWIAVASAHRAQAFEACRWIIDTLKKTVPIWKREFFEDGAVWADGEPFPGELSLRPTAEPRK